MLKKNIYKKSLAMDLIRYGHDVIRVKQNVNDERWQVYVFKETPELIRDLLYINERTHSSINKLA